MNLRISTAILSGLAAVLFNGWFGANADDNAGAAPPAAIPTISTADVAREGFFYVGGHYVGGPGKETIDGAMYVEVIVPKKIRHPYPIVIVGGASGQSEIGFRQTPDGRPGWAYDFVSQGYTVYMMDLPTRGRSPYLPEVDGNMTMPRSASLMEEIWAGSRAPSSEQTGWPQANKASQWPGEGPNKGKIGDPVFDAFVKSQFAAISPTLANMERLGADAIIKLLDLIDHPVIMLINSGVATSGWVAIDSRPKVVKGIVAVEPTAPPIMNAERGATGPGRIWGLTNLPVHYDPPIKDPSELQAVRQDKPDAPDLIRCWIQKEPAHKLVHFEGIPLLDVSAEASYHRPYAHCIAKWLNQAGVKTTFVRLEDVGLRGNGHMMQVEKNSAGISKFLESWIEKNVH